MSPAPIPEDLNHVLQLLDHRWVYQNVTLIHDEAREMYRVPLETVGDGPDFHRAITDYVGFHVSYVEEGGVSGPDAFSIGRQILSSAFPKDCQLDGYLSALATATGRNPGGLPAVINVLAMGFKRNAIRRHTEVVYHEHINSLSNESRTTLIHLLVSQRGPVLGRFGKSIREFDLISKPLDALLLVQAELESVLAPLDWI